VTGSHLLRRTLARLRPRECDDPEILFVPGHCEDRIRRLIYREADGIGRALAAGALNRPLARLSVLERAITPGLLIQRGANYQGLHYAGPTSRPLDREETAEAAWLADLASGAQNLGVGDPAATGDPTEIPVEEQAGAELEVVGVDQITALLDAVAAAADQHGGARIPPSPPSSRTATRATATCTPWLLEDGPVNPETLGSGRGIPPLIFSNSHCSLPTMGIRFLEAGASAFIGPLAALYSRPARKFAGRFYNYLGDGYSVGAALRTAALACREQFGPLHPVWLSYGVTGYGSLALQYL
jgi:hypothetical protein